MRPAIALLFALAPLVAQVVRPASAGAAVQTAPTRVSLTSLAQVSRGFDLDLRKFALNDPIDVLGNTRGVYLEGFGAIFTTEISPILTPQLSPFRPNISEQEKSAVRLRKLARLPAVERLVGSLLQAAAKQLPAVPDDEQIVVAVKFLYLPYEDTTGLPGQMVAKASRHTILSGTPVEAMVTNQ